MQPRPTDHHGDKDDRRELARENARLRAELDALKQSLDAIHRSTTWWVVSACYPFLRPVAELVRRWRRIHAARQTSRRLGDITSNSPSLTERFGLRSVPLVVPTALAACNPTILATSTGWLAIVRAHNYVLYNGGRESRVLGDRLRNESWLVTLNDDLSIVAASELTFRWSMAPHPAIAPGDDLAANGFEDCRLLSWNGGTYLTATATTWDTATTSFRNTMAFGRLRGHEVSELVAVESPSGATIEKNWMPVVVDDTPCAVHWLQPFHLITLEPRPRTLAAHDANQDFDGYRGSSQLVPFDGGWLCVVHKRHELPDGLFYTHRLVYLDSSWHVRARSGDFFFEHAGIEFCAGIAIKGDRVIFSYGINDAHARLLEASRSQVEALLRMTQLDNSPL